MKVTLLKRIVLVNNFCNSRLLNCIRQNASVGGKGLNGFANLDVTQFVAATQPVNPLTGLSVWTSVQPTFFLTFDKSQLIVQHWANNSLCGWATSFLKARKRIGKWTWKVNLERELEKWTGHHDMTKKLLKTVLNPNQSINVCNLLCIDVCLLQV